MNFKIPRPTIHIPDWAAEEPLWSQLNQDIGGNLDFSPLTVKGAYVIGVIYSLCESVDVLMHSLRADVSLMPAYGIFASGLDLLGRCLNGNSGTAGVVRDLNTGFNWIAALSVSDAKSTPVITTSTRTYTVGELTQFRHFASHGQATTRSFAATYDYELLAPMPAFLAKGLDGYWNELQRSDDFCNNLALANILALRSWPVLRSWSLFEMKSDGTYESITEIFGKFDWRSRQ